MTLYQQQTGIPQASSSIHYTKRGKGMAAKSQKPSASPSSKIQNIPPSGQTRELKIVSTNGNRSATVFNDTSDAADERYHITDDVYIWAVHVTPSTDEATYPKPLHIVSRDTVRRTIATFYQTFGEQEKGGTGPTVFYKFPGAIYCPGGFDADTSAAASGKVGTLTIFYSLAHQGSMIGGQANR